MKPTYESPLASRYASKTMLHLFSPDMRYETWRRLWVALARAEHNLGLPVTQAQVDELAAHVSPIDYDVVAAREKEVRHDVMAHIYAYGLDAPGAKGIIHLGATSCYVTDNADLILYREALRYLERELKAAMRNLCEFADRYAAMPALAYTHYQPAQLTTIGKRASLWLQDLMLDLEEVQDTLRAFRFLGCRGTTGTEASFVELFDGDTAKIDEMNRQIAAEFGFARCYPVCGQTYPRKLDSRILGALSSLRGYVWPQTSYSRSKPKSAAMRRFISSIFAVSPSNSARKLASVPVVPRQPRKRMAEITSSSSSRSSIRS